MAYDANIPQPNDLLSQSQIQILGNFQGIGTLLSPDTGAVTFPAGGDTATNATTVALYSKIDNGTAQLFYRPVNSGTPIDVSSFVNTLALGFRPTGWSNWFNGLQCKWSSDAINANSGIAVNLNAIGPVNFTTWVLPLVSFLPTGTSAAMGNVVISGMSPNAINIYNSSNFNGTFFLFVFGV